jgi:serine protease Do
MQAYKKYLLPVLAIAVLAPQAWAQPSKKDEKNAPIRRLDRESPRRGSGETESVTFLGVETAPLHRTLSAQLGLARDIGLIVTRLAPDSPAAEVLNEDDILTKFDDQLVVNMPQLGALVRSKKEGDEVKLTVIRGGKEMTVSTKLISRDVPKVAQRDFSQGGADPFNWLGAFPDLNELNAFPGMGADHARDVLRMLGRERANALNSPRMHIRARGDRGSTILDLAQSNISYSDDEGSIELKSENDQRTLTVKDASGKVLFDGPYSSAEDRQKVPKEIAERVQKIDVDTLNFEPGADFKSEVVPLRPTTKTKIRHEIEAGTIRSSRPL